MIYQPNNPSNEVRHEQLKNALSVLNREEDFHNIIKLTSPPPPITNILPYGSLKDKRIGVIGAGCAGLACSYELRKLGCDVTILEANPSRIGGRIYTHFFDKDFYGELGAMRIPVSHETSWHYINELNLNTNPFYQTSENDILYVKKMRFSGLDINEEATRYLYPKFNLTQTEQSIPLSKLVEYAYNQPILNLPVDIRAFIIAVSENYPDQIDFYDQLNFRKMCNLLGLSTGAIDLIYSVIGADSGFFYFNFLEILKEAYPTSFYYLYEITGGLYHLPYAFYESFKIQNEWLGNVLIKMGMRVTGIYYEHDKVLLKYIDQSNQVMNQEEFDYVVCTIPFSSLRLVDILPLFSNLKMEAIREVNYSPSQKTLILFNEQFWKRDPNLLGGRIITDQPIISTWFPSHEFRNNYGVLLASYNMNLDATRLTNVNNNFTIYQILRQLEACYGFPTGYLDHKILDYKILNWNKYDYNLGAFAKYYPQQNSLFAYPSITPEFNHKVYFAGEHTSGFHGWIQGALQSAMVSANELALFEKNKL